MTGANKSYEELLAENERLRLRLEEAEETLRAIGSGGKDAFMVSGPEGQVQENNEEFQEQNQELERLWEDTKLSRKTERANDEQFRAIFELSSVGIGQADPSTRRLLLVNDKFCMITGYSRAEMLQMTIDDITYPEDRARDMELFESGKQKESASWTFEKRYIRKDGAVVWVEVNATMLFDPDGHPTSSIAVIIDITRRKQSEEAIRRVKEEWERTFDSVPDLIAILDNEHRIMRVNDSLAKRLGLKKEECIGVLCYEAVHGSTNPPDYCPYSRTIEDGQEHTAEQHVDQFGGDFQITTNSLLDENGERIGSVHVAHDITERKRMEEALRESEERLAMAMAGGRMGLWEWDPSFNRLVWNSIEYQLLGLPVGAGFEATQKFFDLVHPDDIGPFNRILADVMKNGNDFQHELRIIRANDGQVRWLAVAGRLFLDADGQPVKMIGVNFDVSARKHAEQELKQLNEELENRVEERTKELLTTVKKLMTEIVERKKAEDRVLRLNRLYKVVSETSQAIIRTMDRETIFNEFCRIAVEDGKFKLAWVGLMDKENSELRVVAAYGATGCLDDIKIAANEEPSGIGPAGISVREGAYYISTDLLGSPITRPWREWGRAHGIRASASVALKQEGEVIGALTLYAGKKDLFDRQQTKLISQMGADVSFALDNIVRETRRKEAEWALREETIERLLAVEALREKEQMLIQQSRQAAMGEMIGNIAHQWRQPLNTLGLTVQQLLLFNDMDGFTREFLEQIVGKSMQLIQHMSQTIDDFRNYFRPDKEKVEFEVSEAVTSTLSLIEDSFKSENIRIKFIAKSEPVIVGYRNEYSQVILNILNNARDIFKERNIKDPMVSITIFTEGNRAVVTIADNAGGIPEEIMGKIFDPYFTTKGPQAGTGVGLFMSKSIIEKNMGGRLSVRNHGNGAEFRIEV